MVELKLKRGYGRSFVGENWQLVGESKWTHHRHYLPNGREPFHGVRKLDGVDHAVFRCFNDDFFAQPVGLCEFSVPEDPMEVMAEPPEGLTE